MKKLMSICPGIFEKYNASKPDGGLYLVARECIIRQISERENIPWGGALCHLRKGIIWSFLEHVTGRKLRLEIVKPGYYGCLLSLTPRDGKEVDGSWNVEIPSEETYTRKAMQFLDLMFENTLEIINRTIGPATRAYLKRAGYEMGVAHASVLQQTKKLEEAIAIISEYLGFCELQAIGSNIEGSCFDEFKGLGRYLVEGFLEGMLSEILNKKVNLSIKGRIAEVRE
jgi:predicted hydrocarbon binding protein